MSLSYAKREELFDKFRKTRQPGKEFTEQIVPISLRRIKAKEDWST